MKVVHLIGSPKGEASTSKKLGGRVVAGLVSRNWESSVFTVRIAMKTEELTSAMLSAIDACDVVVFTFPLYVDSLPAVDIRFMERCAEQRKYADRKPLLLAIANCGFPEEHQNLVALKTCKLFCRDANFTWAGGLSLGAGAALGARELEDLGWMTRHVRQSLDLAAASLADLKPICDESMRLMNKPMMPKWIYIMIANRMMKKEAKRAGTFERMRDTPYVDGEY